MIIFQKCDLQSPDILIVTLYLHLPLGSHLLYLSFLFLYLVLVAVEQRREGKEKKNMFVSVCGCVFI